VKGEDGNTNTFLGMGSFPSPLIELDLTNSQGNMVSDGLQIKRYPYPDLGIRKMSLHWDKKYLILAVASKV
jgi:hypothetical protein